VDIERIGIVGGGAWGTALATVAARTGHGVLVWAREAEVVEAINCDHENTVFLPGVVLDPAIEATSDLTAMGAQDALLLVTPAQAVADVAARLAPVLDPATPVVLCSKGLEQQTGRLMSEVFEAAVPGARTLVLSGPSFAADVARGLPTAVTLAGPDPDVVADIAEALNPPTFRPYLSGDVIGAQIGGAVKNVLAIACGIIAGRALGASAAAALITRGFAEMVRFGTAHGAEAATMNGLSGLGDLVLTCSSPQSRNMSLGMELGRGRGLADVLGERNSVSEGVFSAASIAVAADRLGIDMPICRAIDHILNHGADIDHTIAALLNRPLKAED
jgi:glycerol-3-phosphate dehydrogenase (NAD(P)+)